MLTEVQIKENKEKFLSYVESISREGFDKESLIKKLNNSDFFEAPASTKYHLNCKGGLCQHSLNVYECLKSLVEVAYKDIPFSPFEEDSLKIVGLFHDISKMNFYKVDQRNKKEYSPTGSKKDNYGNYDWVSESYYTVRDPEDRFIFGTHGQNSERIISYFIPLSEAESSSIIHHHLGMDFKFEEQDISNIMKKYPLLILLHTADIISAYIKE